MDSCPEIKERLTDSEIHRVKREAIDLADSHKEKGKSEVYDEMADRERVSTRKSWYFKVPWKD